jgi:hypothetical protein
MSASHNMPVRLPHAMDTPPNHMDRTVAVQGCGDIVTRAVDREGGPEASEVVPQHTISLKEAAKFKATRRHERFSVAAVAAAVAAAAAELKEDEEGKKKKKKKRVRLRFAHDSRNLPPRPPLFPLPLRLRMLPPFRLPSSSSFAMPHLSSLWPI